jgi:hypothetical protein
VGVSGKYDCNVVDADERKNLPEVATRYIPCLVRRASAKVASQRQNNRRHLAGQQPMYGNVNVTPTRTIWSFQAFKTAGIEKLQMGVLMTTASTALSSETNSSETRIASIVSRECWFSVADDIEHEDTAKAQGAFDGWNGLSLSLRCSTLSGSGA